MEERARQRPTRERANRLRRSPNKQDAQARRATFASGDHGHEGGIDRYGWPGVVGEGSTVVVTKYRIFIHRTILSDECALICLISAILI